MVDLKCAFSPQVLLDVCQQNQDQMYQKQPSAKHTSLSFLVMEARQHMDMSLPGMCEGVQTHCNVATMSSICSQLHSNPDQSLCE